MQSDIITKFTVATEQSIKALSFLAQTIAREKFSLLLSEQELENYISKNCSIPVLVQEVNSMNNQWLIVYVNDAPAGFSRITSKGKRPDTLTQKRAIRIADFGIQKAHDTPVARQSLFDKCWSVCKPYEATWINEYVQNPFLEFFEAAGFTKLPARGTWDALPLQCTFLIKQAL